MEHFTCYKYRSGAAALRCLSESTAYFASPSELNDSLEAKFDLVGATGFADVMHATLGELARSRGYAGNVSDIARVPKGLPKVTAQENKRFLEACQKTGIYSAAPRPDNQPMWAYYCDNFRGVCFHLEWSKEVIERYRLSPSFVTYSSESRIFNRADDLRDLLLELGRENPTWSFSQLAAFSMTDQFLHRLGIKTVARAVSMKHADWAHEREVRIIAPHSGPLPVMQDILKSVIFVRTDFSEWGSIMMLLHRLYPNVQLADMSFHHKEPFVRSRPLKVKKIPITDIGGRRLTEEK